MSKTAHAPKMFDGYSHIIDDGDCNDHGYILPKQTAGNLKRVVNCGVVGVEVPPQDLRDILLKLSARQQDLLASIK
jgi:hypothetical protein